MSRSPLSRGLTILLAAALLVAGGPPRIAHAATEPLVVGADRGGDILARVIEVRGLRESGRSVRIVGDICASSCTLYLALPQTCISRGTVFGFHGPSRRGARLPRPQFERASRVIAAHYPAALRRWYMDVARHEISDIHRLSGADLIAMGVRPC